MILLTDGEDQGSRLKIKDAIEAAQKADAAINYALYDNDGNLLVGDCSNIITQTKTWKAARDRSPRYRTRAELSPSGAIPPS